MKIYLGIVDGNMDKTGYTSLTKLCSILKVPYVSAQAGKRYWIKPNKEGNPSTIIEIREIKVERIAGRGKIANKK